MSHLVLVAGLVLFLGIHLFLALFRDKVGLLKESLGNHVWRSIHSMFALAGLALIIYGYHLSRMDPVFLWNPPAWTRHTAALFAGFAMILAVASLVPGNHIKAAVGHPLYAAVKLWAFAHIIANGRLGDLLLFGSFLAWSIIGFSSARKRDRKLGTPKPAATVPATLATLALGLGLIVAIVLWLHLQLIGVPVA